MKVLVAATHTSWRGVHRGAERYLDDLLSYLVPRGHDVVVATSTWHERREYVHEGARVVELPSPGPHRDQAFGDAVGALAAEERPDVVHAFELPPALAAADAGLPVLHSVLGVPTTAWLDAHPSAHDLLRRGAAASTEVVALTRSAADAVVAGSGRPDVGVLPPGVRLADFPPSQAPRDGRTVLFVGAADEPRKRFGDVLSAVEGDPRLRLVLATAVDAAPLLEGSPARDRVETTGALARGPLAERYRSAAALACPSEGEAFGLVVVEALACGTPVVVAPGSGPAELVGDAAVGVVDDDVARGLARLLADPPAAADCVARARCWDWDLAVGPQHLAAYDRVRQA